MESCKCPPPTGSRKGRNLVVCIDGTSNQFGKYNTNVVELYSKIIKDEDQITYYNSGIGTYARPSWKSLKYWLQVVDNVVDLAIAWNFERIIMGAYRWLSDNFMENDRIFLLGFSRGAYQVRALAGMLETVGLIHRGNEEQIPFAYELYSRSRPDFASDEAASNSLAAHFKETFSRKGVRVHFVGVWDTVSSVGIIRGKTLPMTHTAEHICFFRHALALDERRVKFLPEYVHGGDSTSTKSPENEKTGEAMGVDRPHVKEVWFPGTHSDIGGGNQLNPTLSLGRTPMLWMSFESVSCGLRLRPGTKVEWAWERLGDVRESMHGVWHALEWAPVRRLKYVDAETTTTKPHRGKGRKIRPGQRVHSSVAFCKPPYHPRAKLPASVAGSTSASLSSSSSTTGQETKPRTLRTSRLWSSIIGNPAAVSSTEWRDILEMDIFDSSPGAIRHLIRSLSVQSSGQGGGAKEREDQRMWIYRLQVVTSSEEGMKSLIKSPQSICELIEVYHALRGDSRHVENAEQVLACIVNILDAMCKGEDAFFNPEEIQWLTNTCLKTKNPDSRALNLARWWISVGAADFGSDSVADSETLFLEPIHSFLLTSLDDEQLANEFGSLIILGMKYGVLPDTFLSDGDIRHLLALSERSGTQVQRSAQRVLQNIRGWSRCPSTTLDTILEKMDHPDPSVRALALGLVEAVISDGCTVDEIALDREVKARLDDSDTNVKLEALKLVSSCVQHGKYATLWSSSSIISALIDLAVEPREELVNAARDVLGNVKVTHFDPELFKLNLESFDLNTVKRTVELLTALLGTRNATFIPEATISSLWTSLWSSDRKVQNCIVEFLVTGMDSPARDTIFSEQNISGCIAMLSSDSAFNECRAALHFLAEAVTEDKWAMFPTSRTLRGVEECLSRSEWQIRDTAISLCKSYILSGHPLTETVKARLESCLCDASSLIRDSTIRFYTEVLHCTVASELFQSSTLVNKLLRKDALGVEFFIAAVSAECPHTKLFTQAVQDMMAACLSVDWMYSLPMKFYTKCIAHEQLFLAVVGQDVQEKIWGRHVKQDGCGDVLDFYRCVLGNEKLAPHYFDQRMVDVVMAFNELYPAPVDYLLTSVLEIGDRIEPAIVLKIQEHFSGSWASNLGSSSRTLERHVSLISRAGNLPSYIFSVDLLEAANNCFVNLGPSRSDIRELWLSFYRKVLSNHPHPEAALTTEFAAALAQTLKDEYPSIRTAGLALLRDVIYHDEVLRDRLLTEDALQGIYYNLMETDDKSERDDAVDFYTAVLQHEDLALQTRILTPSVLDGILRYQKEEPPRFRVYTKEQIHPLKFCLASLSITSTEMQKSILSPEVLAGMSNNLYADNLGKVKSLVVKFYREALRTEYRSLIFNPATTKALLDAISPEHVNGRVISLQMHDLDSWYSNRDILDFLAEAISTDAVNTAMFTPESIAHIWPTIRRLGPGLELTDELMRTLTSTERMKSLIYDAFVIRALCEEKDAIFREGARVFLKKALTDTESTFLMRKKLYEYGYTQIVVSNAERR